MKTKAKTLNSKFRPANIEATYNPELNQYEGKILFPKKFAAMQESIKKHPLPPELLSKP